MPPLGQVTIHVEGYEGGEEPKKYSGRFQPRRTQSRGKQFFGRNDGLCRSAELAWMQVAHVDLVSKTVYIPRAKNDPFADGRIAGLSKRSTDLVSQWLDQSCLKEGALFRGLHTAKAGVGSLETSSIRRLINVAAKRAGLADAAAELSGHSMRVGGAQDLMISGHETLMIKTAGAWKNVEVVARYVEKASLMKRRLLM